MDSPPSPTRKSRRLIGEEPSEAIDITDVKLCREIKSLAQGGGSGGQYTDVDNDWSFQNKFITSTSTQEDLDIHNDSIFTNLKDVVDTTYNLDKDTKKSANCAYQMVNMELLQQWVNENCVCRRHVQRDLDDFLQYCSSINNQMTIAEMKEHTSSWKMKHDKVQDSFKFTEDVCSFISAIVI